MPLALAGVVQPSTICRFDRAAQLVIARQQLSIIDLQRRIDENQSHISMLQKYVAGRGCDTIKLVKDIAGVYEDLDRVFNFFRRVIDDLPLVNRVEVVNNFNLLFKLKLGGNANQPSP